jgi:hypothetical protein
MRLVAALVLLASTLLAQDQVDPRITIADVTGAEQRPFAPPPGQLSALFFVTPDCPVSNSYAREIRRICTTSAGRLTCYLVYTDPTIAPAAITKHKQDYGHGAYAAILDLRHTLVKAVGAAVTPEVALVDESGTITYRGRIDDTYVTAGRRRAQVTDHNLVDAIAATLAGKPVNQPRTKASGCFITPIELFKSLLSKQ